MSEKVHYTLPPPRPLPPQPPSRLLRGASRRRPRAVPCDLLFVRARLYGAAVDACHTQPTEKRGERLAATAGTVAPPLPCDRPAAVHLVHLVVLVACARCRRCRWCAMASASTLTWCVPLFAPSLAPHVARVARGVPPRRSASVCVCEPSAGPIASHCKLARWRASGDRRGGGQAVAICTAGSFVTRAGGEGCRVFEHPE